MGAGRIFATVAAIILIGVTAFFAGRTCAPAAIEQPQSELVQLISKMEPGDRLVIDEKEIRTGAISKTTGQNTSVKSTEDFSRIASFFGLGATEAAAKSQGIKAIDPATGKPITVGEHYGYGVLEQLWTWLKGAFWFVALGVGILFVLTLVPATAPFASGMLRFLAGAIPWLGSVVERIWAGLKFKRPMEQVIKGGERFKELLAKSDVPDYIKEQVMGMFKQAHNEQQDQATKTTVNQSKSGVGQ